MAESCRFVEQRCNLEEHLEASTMVLSSTEASAFGTSIYATTMYQLSNYRAVTIIAESCRLGEHKCKLEEHLEASTMVLFSTDASAFGTSIYATTMYQLRNYRASIEVNKCRVILPQRDALL